MSVFDHGVDRARGFSVVLNGSRLRGFVFLFCLMEAPATPGSLDATFGNLVCGQSFASSEKAAVSDPVGLKRPSSAGANASDLKGPTAIGPGVFRSTGRQPVESKELVYETSRGPLSLRVRLSTVDVLIAEPFEVILELDAPSGSVVQFSELSSENQVLSLVSDQQGASIPIDRENAIRRWSRRCVFESFLAGEQTLPAMFAKVLISGEPREQLISCDLPSIRVESSMEGESNDYSSFRDIKSFSLQPEDLQASWTRWAWGLLALPPMIFWFIRSRRKVETPSDKAVRRLMRELEQGQGMRDDAKLYGHLVTIFRDYLAEQFETSAASLSIREIALRLQEREVPATSISELVRFFERADQIRFSGDSIDQLEPHPLLVQRLSKLIANLSGALAGPTTSRFKE